MAEVWAMIKINRMILIMNIIICGALSAGYLIDFVKGRKSIAFVAFFIVVMLAQLCACIVAYRKDNASDKYKYYGIVGCLIVYCFAIFSSDSYFTYTYVFPLVVLYVLYYDVALIKVVGIAAVVLNIFKVVYQIYHGHADDTDITSYTVQIVGMVIFSVGIYFLTNLTKKINEEKMDKLHEINKNVSDLAHEAEIVSQAEADLLRRITALIPSFVAGSKQVADGAQSLSQGSTEQATAIEQLSSSIVEIAERTKVNAAITDKTSKLSATIKGNAEKGSRQMDDMISAVKEINEASHSISKIIKTIDDIAFQTNILALNAAVEAARAGQHGKGFAVVAEEVRNLASKSAEAAKDTGDMIQNTMDKAELGFRIAGETAASLSEIVSGINASSRLIAEIANTSEQQSLGIAQINAGIDRVAQVVQQNSATAEQSAAASEEMSGQSDVLLQLIAQFQLEPS